MAGNPRLVRPHGRHQAQRREEAMAAMTDLLGDGQMMIPAGAPVVHETGVLAELCGLAAEFPGYDFATQQTWDGISIIARRHEGCARPGLYAVVTGNPDEMRRALREHEQASHHTDGRCQP
jgi:hypothetical protein